MATKVLPGFTFNLRQSNAGITAQSIGPFKDLSNTLIDWTTWDSAAFAVQQYIPNSSTVGAPTATMISSANITGNADGTITVITAAGGPVAAPSQLCLVGKPTSGDPLQVVATGTLSVFA